jgi:hypothetical protein
LSCIYLPNRKTVVDKVESNEKLDVEHWEIFSTSHGIATRGVSINENYL